MRAESLSVDLPLSQGFKDSEIKALSTSGDMQSGVLQSSRGRSIFLVFWSSKSSKLLQCIINLSILRSWNYLNMFSWMALVLSSCFWSLLSDLTVICHSFPHLNMVIVIIVVASGFVGS